jgi:peptide/nickel transport system substrate-binding protein
LLAACVPSRPAGPTGTGSTASPAPLQPRAGGRLRVGIVGDIPNLDPHQLGGSVADVLYPIWDRLMEYGPDTRPRPSLAERWDQSSDGTQLELTLRRGVTFHTGRELTSDDVAWTLNRLKTDPLLAANGFRSQVQPLTAVDVRDKYSLVLKADAPWPGVYNLLCLMSVVDRVRFQDKGASVPVGTGPFAFGEWMQGDHIWLVRNPHYWSTGHPLVDELHFQLFNDSQAMVIALEAEAIDLADRPPLLDAVRLQQDSRFRILISDIGGTRYALLFNALVPPTDNQQFRQALLYALDRRRIVDSVLHGISIPHDLPFATSSPAYDEARDHFYSFDLDRARSLVAASGVVEPTLDFNYVASSREWAGIAQIYQADLAGIGVTLNLKPVDSVALIAELRGRTFNGIMTGIVPLGATLPAQQAVDPYFSPRLSFSGFTSEALLQLADDLQHEVDPAKQAQVYARWSDYVLDQAWTGSIATAPPLAALNPRLHGLRYTQLEMLDYREAWLDA